MSETKHTPGPWRAEIRPYGKGTIVEVWSATGILVAQQQSQHAERGMVMRVTGSYPIPESQRDPNARLIAAAPELLEALRNTLELVEQYRRGEPVSTGGMFATVEQARVAIAKAEGRDV